MKQDDRSRESLLEEIGSLEEIVNSLVANSSLSIAIIDFNLKVCLVNDAASDFSHRNKDDLLGLNMGAAFRCLNYLDNPNGCGLGAKCKSCELRSLVNETIDEKRNFQRVNVKIPVRIDGEVGEASLLVSTSLLNYGKNKVLIVFEEDDDLKEALRISENKFRNLTNVAPAGIYLTDIKGDCVYANSAWLDVAGMKMKDALGTGWVKRIHPDDLELVNSSWYQSQKSKTKWHLEYRFITPEGVVTWVRGKATPYHNSNNEILGYVGINMDITEIMDIQNQLKESEGKYKNLYNNALVGMYRSSLKSGKAHVANREVSRLLGYPSIKTFIDNFRTMDHYIDLEDRSFIVEQLERTGFIEKIVIHARKLDDTKAWLEGSFRLSEDKEMVDCFLYDITDRYRNEEELRKYKDDLEELVLERTKGLEKKNQELDQMLKVFVGRELKIKDLQEELRRNKQSK